MGAQLRQLTIAILLFAWALAWPGAAWAHHDPPIVQTAPITTAPTPPTIDGVLNASEWSDASTYPLDFPSHPGTVYVMHDATYLYIAATIADSAPFDPHLSVFFDNNHDGLKARGDDTIIAFSTFGQDFFYNPTGAGGASHYNDLTDGGTSDTLGAATSSGGFVYLELRQPKMSADATHDIQAITGNTLGVLYQYQSGPFEDYPSASPFDPSTWADLVLSATAVDTTPPTVTITSPPGGSDLSGTVPINADASDNVAVDRVVFEYFDGATFHPLGTDTTAPYSVDFDTTLFPDVPHNAGTVYAQAFDTSGNASTKYGIGIGINNAGAVYTATVGDVSSSDGSVQAGAAVVPESAIPAGALAGATPNFESAPIDSIPIDSIPIDSIPIDSIPIDSIPIDSIGLSAALLQQNALGGVPLSQIPLVPPLSWDTRLAGTALGNVPIVDLTLADVLQSAPGALTGLTLSDITLGASPIDSIPLAAVALGTLPIDSIPILGHTGAQNETDWCNVIKALPGFADFNCAQVSSTTVMGLSLMGAPIDSIPIDSIPIDSIDLSGTALNSITLDSVASNIASSPIDSIPIDSIGFTVSPFAAIPLNNLAPADLANVVDCSDPAFTCSGKTLGQAFAAGKILPDATIGDLGKYTGVTLGNLGRGMDPSVTLNDLLALLLPAAAYDWNDLPFDFPLNDFATVGGEFTLTVPFTIEGRGAPTDVDVVVTLTNGARFVPGSDSVSLGDGKLDFDGPVAVQKEDVETLRWTVHGVPVGASAILGMRVRAGTELGTDTARARVTVGDSHADSNIVSVAVGDTFESNDTAGGAKPAVADTLYESYITSATDRDYFSLAMPPAGAVVTATLERLPDGADYDLVMYGPATAPLRSSPIDSIPIDSIPADDPTPSLEQRSQDVSTETLQDVPTDGAPAGSVVVGASSTRGTAEEEITFVSTGQGGNLVLQVTAFNGAFTPRLPYTMHVQIELPPALPPCQPMSFPNGGSGTPGTIPSIGANVNTLILTNEKQLGDLYGATAEANVVSAANAVISSGYADTVAALVPVESDPAVAAAYAAWNQNPCSPELANDVVRKIGMLLDNISAGRPIQNIVILGSDQVLPAARIADTATVANESGYASTLGYATNNEFLGASANHYFLSYAPYGAKPTPFEGGTAYIPSVGISVVVETPAEIVAQLNQFNTAHGLVDPKTQLVSGYDFLADGAQQTAAALSALGHSGSSLINESWTSGQLDAAMFPSSGTAPTLVAPNAHYDNFRLLPADQNAANLSSALYTTSQLVAHGASSNSGRLVFTVGCHSGVNLPDTLFTGAKALDWGQAFTGKTKAPFYEGNLGFGYGDTITVGYSESLQVAFAKRLDGSLNVGRALAFAQQDYWGTLGTFTNYDVKVIGEAVAYGVGLYKLGSATPPTPPTPAPTFTDSATGLTAASFSFAPSFEPHNTSAGRFYSVLGNALKVNRRPIEPVAYADATQPNLTAHGASFVVTSSSEVTPFDPAFDRLVAASGDNAGEAVGLTTFPTNLVDVRTIEMPTGRQQRIVFVPGQFISDTVPDASGVGTQRLFNTATVTAYYSSSTDFAKPSVGVVMLSQVGGLVGFSVDVTDTNASGGPGVVKAVFANYLDGGTWRKIDLGAVGNHWSGAGPLSGNSTAYFLEAVDAAGNVAVVADKGVAAPVVGTSTAGAVSVNVSGPKNGDWFTGAASATFSAPQGVSVTYSLDGSMFTTYTGSPIGISGDGVHTLVYEASDGSHGNVVIPIDTTGPTITVNDRSYVLGSTGNSFDVRCADSGSGVASCTTTPAVPDTSAPVGAKTVSVQAVDRVGNVSNATGTYHVVYPFDFVGISNIPVLNQATAGQGVPVKFRLGGNRGLAIFADGSPSSTRIACEATAPLGGDVPTVTAGASSLIYDAATDTYSYIWKTEKRWAGTCRELEIKLVDGSRHLAWFKFK